VRGRDDRRLAGVLDLREHRASARVLDLEPERLALHDRARAIAVDHDPVRADLHRRLRRGGGAGADRQPG
jgi:hypothetical protein